MDDYQALNRASWDERAPAHAASPDYAVEEFATDPAYLSAVVRFDLPLLGDIAGLRGVHLQCHIGTDTISLARLGASMTGLDFSPAAVEQARSLAERTGDDARFVEADVYDAVGVLGAAAFDLVFTGIGALCWLPSVRRWADVVAGLLRPGGRLFIREGHPMLWTLEDTREDGLLVIEYPYFERAEPQVWDEGGTYVQTRRDLHPQQNQRMEPRPGRDRHRAAGRGNGADRPDRARQRAVGSPARANGAGRPRMAAGRPALAAGAQLHAPGHQAPLNSRLYQSPPTSGP